jgi:hypothetical protein
MSSSGKTDRLQPSPPDLVALGEAVVVRDEEVRALHLRTKNVPLRTPDGMERARQLAAQMITRHRQRDYRHRDSELVAIREYAQWTVDIKCQLCNQPPKKIDWGPVA